MARVTRRVLKLIREAKAKTRVNYFLMVLLLIVSGNPAFYREDWEKIAIVVVAVILFFALRKYVDKVFIRQYGKYILFFIGIFICQYITLGSVSITFIIGFMVRVFVGAIIYHKLQDRFSPIFFNVLYVLALIALPLYLIHLLAGDGVISSVAIPTDPPSLLFYTIRSIHPGESMLRNSGMFWEPGGYQGFINLCLFMNFNRLPYIMKHERFKLFILVISLLSTQSTTGIILFAFLLGMYVLIYTNMNRILAVFLATIVLVIGVIIFNSVDFLGTKIQAQYQLALQANGEYNPSRFASFLWDLKYIAKHPLIGNGFDPVTRYADDPQIIKLIQTGGNVAEGEGFSAYIASVGILGMLCYFVLIYKNIVPFSRKDAILWMLVILIVLQGEDFLRFSFFFGLPFFVPISKNHNENEDRDINYLLQS